MSIASAPVRNIGGTPLTAPGPTAQQMLPSVRAIRRSPVDYLMRMTLEYGDVVQFPVPKPPSYLVSEPEAVRRVLVGNARNYGKQTIQYRTLSLVTGEGLLSADTESWRQQRPLVQPAFHHSMLDLVLDQSDLVARQVADEWTRRPGIVDVDEAMMRAGLTVVGKALLGTDFSADADRLTDATLAGLSVVIARARVPITPPSWLPTPVNRRLTYARRELDSAVDAILASRGDEPGHDMVGMLISARDDDGVGLTRKQLRDQLVTFIIAGHETVASALTWAWAMLAAHPAALAKLQAEADAVLDDGPATSEQLQRLVYARAVLDETMRLYPPAWLITRSAIEADELAGVSIPAGALVILSPWVVHRNAERWPDPEAFTPERFVDGSADRLAFIPFGAGPRQCIGKDFAYVEAALILARIAQRCSVAYPAGVGVPEADPQVTVRPRGGLHLSVQSR